MKWKLTGQFLLFMIVTIVLVFTFLGISILLLFGDLGKEDSKLPYQSPGNYTLEFEPYIDYRNGKITIPDEQLKQLEQADVWIQVLDENGTEIYSRFKPEQAPVHYTPAQLISYHKYTGALAGSTIFVGMLERGDRNLSYIMGFPEQAIGKAFIYYRTETLPRDAAVIFIVAMLAVTILTVLFGYRLAHRLAKPLVTIIEGIQRLAQGKFHKLEQPKGLYKDVYQNLNQLSAALELSEAERQRLEQMREEWVTNITHDLKTPLASIKGYAEVLIDVDYELNEAEKERYVAIILDKSEYIGELIEDLNLTYQLQSHSFPMNKEQTDVVDLLRESVIQILNHPLYEETNLEFTADIERFPFSCERTLLRRAWMNLIYNAIVHNPQGTPVSVAIREENGHALIAIKDQGKGIPEQDLEKLFVRYYRGTNTGETHKGSGLGLAIAKQIIEAHGGSIHVQSRVGEGTTVEVVL